MIRNIALSIAMLMALGHALSAHEHHVNKAPDYVQECGTHDTVSWWHLLQHLFEVDLGEEHLEHYTQSLDQTFVPTLQVQSCLIGEYVSILHIRLTIDLVGVDIPDHQQSRAPPLI